MTPTEQLKEEHKAIKLALEILEKIGQGKHEEFHRLLAELKREYV